MTAARSRWLALTIGVVALLAVTAGCGDSEDSASKGGKEPNEPIKIAYFNWLKANSFTQGNFRGVQKVAEENGATVTEFDAGTDVTKQVAQIQDATTSGDFDAFIAVPVGPGIVPALNKAMDAGIVVATTNLSAATNPDFNTALPGSVISTNQGYRQRGQAMGQLMVGACEAAGVPDDCKVGYIYGITAFPLEQSQIRGYEDVLKKHPGIEVVKQIPAGAYERAAGRKAAQDILQSVPDVNVLTAVGDQLALGAEDAVKAAGKTGKVQITGEGGSVVGKKAVVEGRFYGTVVNVVQVEGELAAQAVIDELRGGYDGPRAPDVIKHSPIGPVMTKENADGFEPQWEG
jgi:ribose transport system substrate-binding protein